MIPYTDTHCHLDFDWFDEDREAVIERALQSNLVWMLNPGIDLETSKAAIQLSRASSVRINAAVGVHPNFGKPWTEDVLSELKELAQNPQVVAIGEIGLDYYRKYTPVAQQNTMFKDQLILAAELGLPVVIHLRDAMEDLLGILQSWHQTLVRDGNPLADRPGVLHSYSADYETALSAMEMNFFIGISGPVTFRNAPERKSITQRLPLDRLLLETDAPFLAPHPHRGQRNEPAYIPLIAQEIADLHQIDLKTVAEITYANAKYLFRFSDLDLSQPT